MHSDFPLSSGGSTLKREDGLPPAYGPSSPGPSVHSSESPLSMVTSGPVEYVPGSRARRAAQVGQGVPFPTLQVFKEITSEGQRVSIDVSVTVTRNVFQDERGTWTCYRRNYISVQCSYTLTPCMAGKRLILRDRGGSKESERQVQALAVALSAVVDTPDGKSVELIRHTPKRDKGPQYRVSLEKLYPANLETGRPPSGGSLLPLLPRQRDESPQTLAGTSFAGIPSSHTFERIQFKSATANNGRRRAAQQYYHLHIELLADVRMPGETQANWQKVACRISDRLVVRGRSPRHYADGGRDVPAEQGGPSGASGSSQGGFSSGAGGAAGDARPSGPFVAAANPQGYAPYQYTAQHQAAVVGEKTSTKPSSSRSTDDPCLKSSPPFGVEEGRQVKPLPAFEASSFQEAFFHHDVKEEDDFGFSSLEPSWPASACRSLKPESFAFFDSAGGVKLGSSPLLF